MNEVQAIDKANRVRKAMATYEDIEVMGFAKNGETRRAYDYVEVDLPLMVSLAQNRDPLELPNLSARQESVLSLSAVDLALHLEENRRAAARTFAWHAPHLPQDLREFMQNSDGMHEALSKPMIDYQKFIEGSSRQNLAITNNPESPVPDEVFNKIVKSAATGQIYAPGEKVAIEFDDQFQPAKNAEAIVIEKMRISQMENSAYMKSEYQLEGEKGYRSSNEITDARGHEQFYGIIMERAGATYIVPLDDTKDRLNGEIQNEKLELARRISGVDFNMVRHINSQIAENLTDPSMDIWKTQDKAKNSAAVEPISGLKDALGGESLKNGISGEYRIRAMDGPGDQAGPVIIEAAIWQSDVSDEERAVAYDSIERHLEKYEYPAKPFSGRLPSVTVSSQREVGQPQVESDRRPQPRNVILQAQMQLQQGRGF